MPLVANTKLPSFTRLRDEGEIVLDRDHALHQDIRELHIGLLNMMPDAALEATERQFFRLVGESNQIAQFYMHPFSLRELTRNPEGQAHIDRYYKSFDQVKAEGLDALIITGANVTGPELSEQTFWDPLIEIINWAYENVTSTLCSCLATHAVLQFRYGQKRSPLPAKRWGVYSHRVCDQVHPLIAGVNTRFNVPHSRFNEISRQQFEAAGLKILVESSEAGVHLATSEDGFRLVFFQGHPEYDSISLLKEYKREVGRYIYRESREYPPLPENYLSLQSSAILEEYQEYVDAALKAGETAPVFPEDLLVPTLDNTWHDSAEAVINNWIGKVYQITHIDRLKPFREGIHPDNPLDLKQATMSD
ncbi:MAG TPA: homoserine O-succinyltransferase [Gammaproteobacteria bacterium]|nr:homoserine O-succinyltransferase [Gammaproteobacteria bacterium]